MRSLRENIDVELRFAQLGPTDRRLELVRTIHKDEYWTTRRAADPVFHSAWREGDVLAGNGVCNDNGPMAIWLLAAKAIKDSGVRLKGDLVLMAVVGEIGVEPVDEFQSLQYLAKEAGTRFAITHGGVGDFPLVAEGTDFGLVGVEAGKAFFKVTVCGNDLPIYTPYISRPTPIEKNPNAIVRMAPALQELEEWAFEYEKTESLRVHGRRDRPPRQCRRHPRGRAVQDHQDRPAMRRLRTYSVGARVCQSVSPW
jgi:acetylornithine deacetylase/succinyl-diaminopimelate desuccinylase-like protein